MYACGSVGCRHISDRTVYNCTRLHCFEPDHRANRHQVYCPTIVSDVGGFTFRLAEGLIVDPPTFGGRHGNSYRGGGQAEGRPRRGGSGGSGAARREGGKGAKGIEGRG